MKKRYLLVEDDIDVRDAFLGLITLQLNAEVTAAQNGEEAIEILKTRRNVDFDAVITDTNMPILNGVALLDYIREHHPSLPVIVLFSGLKGTLLNEAELKRRGATAVMTKPQAIADLIPTLESLSLH